MEISEWLKPSENMKEFITIADNGKEGEITKVRLGNTKFGTKMFIDIKFQDGVEKTLVLGKSLAVKLVELLGKDTEAWTGKKGKITNIMMNVPKIGLKERPMFQPIQ